MTDWQHGRSPPCRLALLCFISLCLDSVVTQEESVTLLGILKAVLSLGPAPALPSAEFAENTVLLQDEGPESENLHMGQDYKSLIKELQMLGCT